MVNIKDMIRQADDLHKWADHEADPKIRDRLNRMAEAYVHIAETEAAAQPASVHGMMDVLTHGGRERDVAGKEMRSASPPASAESAKKTNEPRKRQVEKE